MGFWIGILFGALFVYIAVKIGFYETWILFFNLVVSIYLAIFSRPLIEQFLPIAGETRYGDALVILAVAIGAFLLLYGISYVFFLSQFNVPVPRMLDLVGSGFLGFWAGLLIWSFAIVLISATPIYQSSFLQSIGFTEKFKEELQKTNVSYMSWWTNKINNLVSYKSNYLSTEELVDEIYQKAEQKKLKQTQPKIPEPPEPNEPADLTGLEKHITCTDIADQNSLSSWKSSESDKTGME
jgi:hypothetical protein